MPKLNEHRIVKRRNGFFPFNYEGGTIGMFQNWGWHSIAITIKKAYERFKETGECIYKYYGNRV